MDSDAVVELANPLSGPAGRVTCHRAKVVCVPDALRSRLAELQVKSGQLLFDFLKADLDIGLTFVRLSQTERGLDETASKQAMLHAEQAIETVKHFRDRIDDEERSREIEKRLAELESLVSATHH